MMEKLIIKEAIIVEGRYDKNTLSQVVDAVILETKGFGIFNDAELIKLLRFYAVNRGLIVFTDSDGAGFMIRNKIKGALTEGSIKQAYIPDIYGKERRKTRPSGEGKLGVEGMTPQIIRDCLIRAGATVIGSDAAAQKAELGPGFTKADFYEMGLSGRPDSAARRAAFTRALNLPEKMSAEGLIDAVNTLLSVGFTRQDILKANGGNDTQ